MTAQNSLPESTLIAHLEALRKMLISCLTATALLYPAAYFLSSDLIDFLVRWSFPGSGETTLYYFAPMEVFWVQLKLGLILALILAYPWNLLQIWRFLLPALYQEEQKLLGFWIVVSTLLFFAGMAFCVGLILPMLMKFSLGFATPELQPMLGLSSFLHLAGWMMLAFGIMFQSPILVLSAVRFGFLSTAYLREKRPYVMTVILIVAAVLTPPDVVSQLALAIPTWLLFELGLFFAKHIERKGMKEDDEQT